jgi:hypothetical protein
MSTGACRWPSVSTANTATWQTVCSSSERWLVPRYATSEDCAGWASVEPHA